MKKRKKVSIITLGCSKNTVDSERLMRQLQANNIGLQNDPDKSDAIIINTCGFIEAAKEESVDTILKAINWKSEGKTKKVIVAGCLSERYKSELQKEIPEVDIYFGTECFEGIVKELGGELKYNLLGERVITTPSHTAYLKISEGCDRPCSFCAIPIMRGNHKSKPIEELVREAEFLASNNTRELVIIAQDTTGYGKDLYNKQNLAELLNKLSKINGIEWMRIMYAYPSRFPEDLINEVASNEKICNYIDIPLQHISDSLLKSMRRGITKKQTLDLVNKLREGIPELVLRTTFIVGYPNETEKEFNELCEFISDAQFDRVGTFDYSQEENTVSYEMGDTVPHEEKLERRDKIMELQKEVSLKKNSELKGKKLKVLVEALEGDFYIGRSYRDAPEVDGEVLIPVKNKKLKIGEFYLSEVYDYNEYDLFADVAEK
jgi:ribosomal protein S12 methylthiotransferase